jgi:intraflagellar transport protein 56
VEKRELNYDLQVVFRGGEKALQVLPALVDVLSEARLNLIIYYLRQTPSGKHSRAHRNLFTFNNSDLDAALTLVDELEPQNPPEFIIKAIVYTLVGQHNQLVSARIHCL